MFVVNLTLENKMIELKKYYQSLNFVGSCCMAVTLPWIVFKVFRAIYLQRSHNSLIGKIVVITGASSGLGEALAHAFYKRGCQVVLCARRRQELDRVRTELLQTHCTVQTFPPIIIPLDLSEYNNLSQHVTKILSITGHIDILINNGGVSHRGHAVSTNVDVDMKIMLVNYFGSIALTKAVLPSMIKKNQGHVVFVSSIQGLVALPERSAYSASKHALQAFGDSLRAEVASKNISVTVASPGYIKTRLSLNALTGSGAAHGQMDKSTESGYSPEFVSERIFTAVARKEKELVISTMLPKVAIFLRKYLPALYFFAMEKRANKADFIEEATTK
ncbi:unnamed protein product [Brassicogethes aeneus]|uniref:Dehydrogenase/reductase SDR family protein 7-like n=1 Tax=Brassicogethes aeneus TaxID=1431903 RepID=A0A9P0FK27_BRAAE|nr:unnamed protein product [Brassicogethes aeneus]